MKRTKTKSYSKQHIQNRRPIIILVVMALITFTIPALSNTLQIISFLFIPFFISDISAPPVILFNLVLIVTIVGLSDWLWIRKKFQKSERVALVVVVSIVAIVLALLLARFTIPLYQQYQVTHVPIAMKTFLENKYREPFTVVDAHYKEVRILGDAKGVTATAYPLIEPSYRFTISQDHDGNFKEEYIDLYGKKISDKVSKHLSKDLEQEFGMRVKPLNVSVQEYDTELFIGAVSSARSISLIIPETFEVEKWQQYKSLLERLTALLNRKPYESYQYYIQITPAVG